MRHLSLLALFAAVAPAYNPPVDTAGPITIKIEEPAVGLYGAGGPAPLNRTGVPFSLVVAIENKADTAVTGTMRLGVIDGWKASPSGPAPFTVPAHGTKHAEFQVTIGEGSYSAHYPLHAYAEFSYGGNRLTAHAVMVIVTQLANPPRAVLPVEWKPVDVPEAGSMGLGRLPLHRESAHVAASAIHGGKGAGESFQAAAPVEFGEKVNRGTERTAVSIALGPRSPSFQETVASAFTEYPLKLGKTQPIRLRFANAVSSGNAIFRVRVAAFGAPSGLPGTVVYERHSNAQTWESAEAPLNRFAGQEIRLQLEAETQDGSSATRAYWAEPVLEAGHAPASKPSEMRTLGKAGGYEIRWQQGARGLLDGAVVFAGPGKELRFQGFRIQVLGDALEGAQSTCELREVHREDNGGRIRIRHSFRSWAGSFDVLGELWTEREALHARWWLEKTPAPKPWLDVHLEEVGAGPWNKSLDQVYAGPGNVIRHPGAFRMGFDGHHLATSFVGFDFEGGVSLVQAIDAVPDRLEVDPEAHISTLIAPHSQTQVFIPAGDVWAGARIWRALSPARASAGVSKLAGRFIFDIWGFGANYAKSAADLEKAFQYGLTDSAVVWHNWQRWGYDYRLPDVFPPNPEGGTLEDFVSIVRACRRNGVLFAPHDNYIDFYPDATGFTYDDVVFRPDGQPYKAWYRWGFEAQSYRFRPDRVRSFLERNVRMIRDGISPTAYFIDVWSSMGPFDYWTKDGQFVPRGETRRAWGESFAWIRNFLGENAPQMSEAGHDQLIGWLDGSQANILRIENPPATGFFWSIQHEDSERIPWLDAVYHDRFAVHGAGYEDRYAGGLDLKDHGIYSADYITTEVLTGHPGMVAEPFGREVVRKYWLTHELMRALALRNIESVEFSGGDMHRQHVRWDNGAEVWVNRGKTDWETGSHTLPQYGFYAHVPDANGAVEAAIERRGMAVVDWAKSPGVSYSDGFRVSREGDAMLITPLPESSAFEVRLRWNAMAGSIPEPRTAEAIDGKRAALHPVDLAKENGEIRLRCEPGVFAYRLK
ncbi:MAG: hypothetical protein U0Q18_06610 [Bryobacteraceae bacterium]